MSAAAVIQKAPSIIDLYRNPVTGLTGLNTFARFNNIPLAQAKEALQDEDAYTLNRSAVSIFPRRKIIVTDINQQWQADLADFNKELPDNDGFRYCLFVIDCFSKYLWVEPLKNKTASEVTNAFQKIFDSVHPQKLQTDDGKEFYNRTMEALLTKLGIIHFSTYSNTKGAIVERVIRTIRSRLTRLWSINGNYNWIDFIQEVVEGYNNTKHLSIGMTPVEAQNPANREKVIRNLYPTVIYLPKAPKFKKGDHVRISIERGLFAKKSVIDPWSREIFVVSEVVPSRPYTYRLQDLNGENIKGGFYTQELQLVTKPEKFGIEILKSRNYKGKRQYFVHWVGYPDKMDEWIDAEQVD